MSSRLLPEQALEILLPDGDDQAVRRAHDVTRFLRLLSNDARPAQAAAVGVDLEHARSELELADRADLECALTDLLRHYLSATCAPDSFAWFGEPAQDVRAAWRLLGEFEAEHDWLATVPLPGESAAALVARLVASLERIGLPSARLGIWRARVAQALEGPRVGERAFRELLRRHDGGALAASETRAAVAGVAECLLERGAVREARTLLFEHLAHHCSDLRARQLLSWTRLALGDAAGARALLVGLKPWLGPLPSALASLREARPEWLPCLAGRVVTERAQRSEQRVTDRSECGASILAVFAFSPEFGAHALHLDAAPALRERATVWQLECRDTHETTGSAEQRGIAEARAIIDHVVGDTELRHAVGTPSVRARALVPILDDDAEVAGWVYLECEHHLLPGPERLAALARGWRVPVLLARAPAAESVASDVPRTQSVQPRGPREPGPCARVFQQVVAALGLKLYQRRWTGIAWLDGEWEQVAQGGEAVGFESERRGGGRALARAIATSGRISFDEPDERLALHPQAASGFVLPLAAFGRAVGFLEVESSRRRDFKTREIDNYAPVVASFGLALRLAEWSEWHRARFRFEPWFDAARADFEPFARHLITAARSRSAVVLAGAPGVGKLVLARWVHFESEFAAGPFKVYACGLEEDARTPLLERIASAAGGTLVLDDVEELAPSRQEELLRALEGVERAADLRPATERATRIVATTRTGLGAGRTGGHLRQDLAARLDRLTLLVPALCDRREEIPALIDAMSRRFADEEGRGLPHLSDEALALLWRQPWHENLRGLENVVYKLVLLHGGDAVETEDLKRLARHFGLDLLRKLPSRHPRRRDILAALRTTRTIGGRANKTRAAFFLGWDPDTLVARMQSEGVDEAQLQDEDAWQVHPDVEMTEDESAEEADA